VGTNNGVLNPNLASGEELATVPHINPDGAAAIVEGRPYLTATAFDAKLRELSLTDEQRAEVRTRLFVPINLNTATDEEMMLVPGVGNQMAHEFEEYRPWEGGMLRFRREIGKYVDDEEVARLEQYVFVPMDLNTASSEDMLTIPGVGDRMVHEFEEYRPYVDMAQFRREIGKYVDDNEVARLERYFVIPR
jgi:DNA uptake protein ComE-like DNA-binding protein